MFDQKPVSLSLNDRKRNIPESELAKLESKLGQVALYSRNGKVKEGEKIPTDLTFVTTDGKTINLYDLSQTQSVVIFIYPGDKRGLEYPELYGCTPEACAFQNKLQDFKSNETLVFGASTQTTERQKDFVGRAKLEFPIISDTNKQLSSSLGIKIWRANESGEEFLDRSTVIIEKGGTLKKIIQDVKIEGHVDEVLHQLKNTHSNHLS